MKTVADDAQNILYLSAVNIYEWCLSLKPEKVFLWMALTFGLLFIVATPPLQVPDEPAHFLRCWQISEGQLLAVKSNNRIGGNVPLSLEKMSHPFWLLVFPGTPVNVDTLKRIATIPINPSVRKFKDFNNTALYSPLCYAPQALGIFILRTFNVHPLFIFYFGRICALLAWIAIVFFAITLIPIHKWLITLLALLPMSLYVNISYSADAMTNAVSLLFIAAVLRVAFRETPVSSRAWLFVMLLAFLVVSMKTIYAALVLLLFIIPRSKFNNRKEMTMMAVAMFALVICSIVTWTAVLQPLYLSHAQYDPVAREDLSIVAGADIHAQLEYCFNHPLHFPEVFFRSVISSASMYLPGYIGTFGWLSLQLPLWVIISTYLVIFTCAVIAEQRLKLSGYQKAVIAITFFALLILLFLSQHLIWDPVGGPLISNIQGRYFIPFAPLLFFLLPQRSASRLLPLGLLVFIFSVLTYSCVIIYCKYYGG
jgi:uncharacterized membrane protein